MTLKELLEDKKVDTDNYLLLLEEAIIFCLRVDTKEVRSTKTYRKFINIIEKITGLTWQQVKNTITLKGVKY